MSVVLVFFFKQKTAYEMRISYWSSDVCSSDLRTAAAHAGETATRDPGKIGAAGRCLGRTASGRTHPVGDPQGLVAIGERGQIPPRPVLPHQRDRTQSAAAARTPRRHPGPRRSNTLASGKRQQ